MKQSIIAIVLLAIATPAFAKTHHEVFNVPCSELWPAVKDTLRNSGKYGIIGIDNTEMTASYNMGGNLTAKRFNSLILNSQGENCELQIQTAFSGLVNNDAGDLKKRVDDSLAKLKAANASKPAATAAPSAQPPVVAAAAPAPEAAVQPAGAASTTELTLLSAPDGADIELDGAFVGSTPSTVALANGDHTVRVTKKGYQPYEKKLRTSGGTINLRAELDPIAQ